MSGSYWMEQVLMSHVTTSCQTQCGIYRSEMLKNNFQIFMRVIFFMENMNP